jgi:hypothetical protein
MPIYEYENDQGRTLLLHRPVDQRDEPTEPGFRRRTIPSRLSVGVGAPPMSTGEELRRGYYKLEERGQLKDRPGYLSAAKVKRALEMPD